MISCSCRRPTTSLGEAATGRRPDPRLQRKRRALAAAIVVQLGLQRTARAVMSGARGGRVGVPGGQQGVAGEADHVAAVRQDQVNRPAEEVVQDAVEQFRPERAPPGQRFGDGGEPRDVGHQRRPAELLGQRMLRRFGIAGQPPQDHAGHVAGNGQVFRGSAV
jgi:hypothetical protein